MAAGDELLIVDARDPDREGMRKLFEEAGYVCSATGSGTEARNLVEKKFFPVALVDLDVGRPGAGLDVVRAIRERSKPTEVILLSGRRSFEGAVEALRLGVADVVIKRPDQIDSLKQAVEVACDRYRSSGSDTDMLRDVNAVMGEAIKIILDMGRKQHADMSTGSPVEFKPRILVVDDDQAFLQELAGMMQQKGWDVAADMNGGAALDRAGRQAFELVVCRAELMDLGGSMVVKTIQAQRPETIGVVYTSADEDGHIGIFREGHMEEGERPFKGATHLMSRLETLVEMLGSTKRDRRIIQVFRSQHEDFFRRYASLKLRISRMLE